MAPDSGLCHQQDDCYVQNGNPQATPNDVDKLVVVRDLQATAARMRVGEVLCALHQQNTFTQRCIDTFSRH
jgi:hypothetical protein